MLSESPMFLDQQDILSETDHSDLALSSQKLSLADMSPLNSLPKEKQYHGVPGRLVFRRSLAELRPAARQELARQELSQEQGHSHGTPNSRRISRADETFSDSSKHYASTAEQSLMKLVRELEPTALQGGLMLQEPQPERVTRPEVKPSVLDALERDADPKRRSKFPFWH